MAPRFSICTPVHDPPLHLLRAMLDSIVRQTCADWELCLVDDGSSSKDVRDELGRRVALDSRIRLLERGSSGGIVAASNDALEMAAGEFIVLLDHDDLLERDALDAVAAALDSDPAIDYLYTDENKVEAGLNAFYDDFYKPDWSPERLRSQNYCTHLSVLRRSVVDEVGRFRLGTDGAQDHDLILRVSEQARRVHHIPRVLYHWAASHDSAASEIVVKPYAEEAGRQVVADHLERVGIAGRVEHLAAAGCYRVRRDRPAPPPHVSIVMLTAGAFRPVWGVERPLVLDALRSLLEVTDYPSFEVVVVVDPATPEDVRYELEKVPVRLVEGMGPFNYSARCNAGVAASSGELVVLLNDDVLVEQPDWLDVMVGFFVEADVGAVGARLLYADGRLQHGGILLNAQPLHIFRGYASDDAGPFALLQIDREVSAVTGACLATRRSLFDELGGLFEELAVSFNDLDYCLRLRKTGRRIIWTPHATLYHFESQTRRGDADQHEIDLLYERWGRALFDDPYGNPNFAPKQAEWRPAFRQRLATALHPLRSAWANRRRR